MTKGGGFALLFLVVVFYFIFKKKSQCGAGCSIHSAEDLSLVGAGIVLFSLFLFHAERV